MTEQKLSVALLAAAAVVVVSLAIYLYAERRGAEPVSEEEAQLIAEQGLLTTELMQESLEAQIEGQQQSARERLDSPTGQALMTRCLEWQQFHSEHPSEETDRNRERACSEYETFVATGELPATPD